MCVFCREEGVWGVGLGFFSGGGFLVCCFGFRGRYLSGEVMLHKSIEMW